MRLVEREEETYESHAFVVGDVGDETVDHLQTVLLVELAVQIIDPLISTASVLNGERRSQRSAATRLALPA